MDPLRTFLSERRAKPPMPFNFVSKGSIVAKNPAESFVGKFFIENTDLDDFYKLYCNYVRKNSNAPLSIAEVPTLYGPLRVDFDFKAQLDQGLKRQYTPKMIRKIIRVYQNEIRKIVSDSEFSDKMLTCVVLEKPAPRVEESVIKDGFHLHFPFFIVDEWMMDTYLRGVCSNKIIEQNIFSKAKFTTKMADIIDQKMAKKPWLLYGSANIKTRKSTAYILNDEIGGVYNYNLEKISLDNEYAFKEEMDGRLSRPGYYLPRFLSIRSHPRPTTLNPETNRKRELQTNKKTRKRRIQVKRSQEDIVRDLKFIKDADIMSMIGDDRSDDYHDWMDVGWTLFNIGQGCEDALEMWIDFSRRSEKFQEGVCEKEWNNMEVKDKSVGSLIRLARLDSPDRYLEYQESNVHAGQYRALAEEKPVPYDIAALIKIIYGDRFCCAGAKQDLWYEFYAHRWREMDGELPIRHIIVEDIRNKFSDLHAEIGDVIARLEQQTTMVDGNLERTAQLSAQVKQQLLFQKRCKAIMTVCKDDKFQTLVIRSLKLFMYDATFSAKIDEDIELLCCENGVLDLKTLRLRDGSPDDYCTYSTGLYYQHYDEDDEDYLELMDIINKVYPDPEIRDYVMNTWATCMRGGNTHKRFYIMTGESDGGKSLIMRLLEYTFGNEDDGYFGKFPRAVFIRSTANSGNTQPEALQSKGKRIMGGQEVTHNESFNIGFLKEATGNDSQRARGLFNKKFTLVYQKYTLIIGSNELPRFPGDDEAMWSRIRAIHHESKFVKSTDRKKFPVPKDIPEQYIMRRFKADETLLHRLKDYAPVLLYILFERFKIYAKGGYKLREPKRVIDFTNIKQLENDIYRQFYNEKIEKVPDDEAVGTGLKLVQIHNIFEEWYKYSYPDYYIKERIGKNRLLKSLTRITGRLVKNSTILHGFNEKEYLQGYRLKIDDDDDKTPSPFEDSTSSDEKIKPTRKPTRKSKSNIPAFDELDESESAEKRSSKKRAQKYKSDVSSNDDEMNIVSDDVSTDATPSRRRKKKVLRTEDEEEEYSSPPPTPKRERKPKEESSDDSSKRRRRTRG